MHKLLCHLHPVPAETKPRVPMTLDLSNRRRSCLHDTPLCCVTGIRPLRCKQVVDSASADGVPSICGRLCNLRQRRRKSFQPVTHTALVFDMQRPPTKYVRMDELQELFTIFVFHTTRPISIILALHIEFPVTIDIRASNWDIVITIGLVSATCSDLSILAVT